MTETLNPEPGIGAGVSIRGLLSVVGRSFWSSGRRGCRMLQAPSLGSLNPGHRCASLGKGEDPQLLAKAQRFGCNKTSKSDIGLKF